MVGVVTTYQRVTLSMQPNAFTRDKNKSSTYMDIYIKYYQMCNNPNLGLVTKATACEGAGQEWSPRVTFHIPGSVGSVGKCEGMNPHTLKWTPILELKFWWIPEISEGNCGGLNSLHWKIPYIIGKFLELKCLKWARMIHLDI
jgi:hypothetical protein